MEPFWGLHPELVDEKYSRCGRSLSMLFWFPDVVRTGYDGLLRQNVAIPEGGSDFFYGHDRGVFREHAQEE